MKVVTVSTTLLTIGTRKGLWLARSDDRRTWALEGPHLLMSEVASVAVDTRRERARLLVGTHSEHWGPTVLWSDDLGATFQETERGAIQFPADTGAALARVWQLQPDSAGRPDVVWAGCEPTSLWRSDDGGRTFALSRGLWEHPHRPEWFPGFGGAAVHTVVPDPASDRVLVAMSTGGVYASDDAGASWTPANRGISAYFLPDPNPEFGQCVHKVAVDAWLRVRQRRRGRELHAGRPAPARRVERARDRAADVGPVASVLVVLPSALRAFTNGERSVDVAVGDGATVGDALGALGGSHPLLARRLFDETGRLRRYVNVYLDGVDVRIGDGMDTPVAGGAELLVLPSVAGG